jgi:transposase
MSVKRCRIRKKHQSRLAELPVAEATAWTAADLVGPHRNGAALFYRKLAS